MKIFEVARTVKGATMPGKYRSNLTKAHADLLKMCDPATWEQHGPKFGAAPAVPSYATVVRAVAEKGYFEAHNERGEGGSVIRHELT